MSAIRPKSQRQKLLLQEMEDRQKLVHQYIDSLDHILGIQYDKIAEARHCMNEAFTVLRDSLDTVD